MTHLNVFDYRSQGNQDNPEELLKVIREYRHRYTETATIALVDGRTVFSWSGHWEWRAAEECDEYDHGHDALNAAIKMVDGESGAPTIQREPDPLPAEERDCRRVVGELKRVEFNLGKPSSDGRFDEIRMDTARAITGFLLRYPDMCAMVRSATRDRDGGPMSQEQWGDDV